MTAPQKTFPLSAKRPSKEQMAAVAKATLAPGSGYVALPPQPGQMIEGQGIYLGQYTAKNRDGKSLRKTFNVFAAPEDLPGTMKYIDVVKHIAKLKDWNGFDGTNYPCDKEIYAALKDGSYNGGWIIPTRDILQGKDIDGKETMPDNILAHKDKGSFKGTFNMAMSVGLAFSDWYWSSSEDQNSLPSMWVARLSDGFDGWHHKGINRLSCRPVRLVAAT